MDRTDAARLRHSVLARLGNARVHRGAALPAVIATGVLIAVLLGLVFFDRAYSGKIYPGVSVGRVSLQGLTMEQAERRISRSGDFVPREVTLRYGQQSLRVPSGRIGLRLDVRATARRAFEVGRTGGVLERLAGRIGTLFHSSQVAPVVSYDSGKAAGVLRELARRVDRPVRNASLYLGPGGPVLTPSQEGRRLEVARSLTTLSASAREGLGSRGPIVVPLAISRTPPTVTTSSLRSGYSRARAAWTHPVRLELQGRIWTLPVDRVRDMLRVQQQGSEVTLALDRASLRSWVEQLAGQLNGDPRDARIVTSDGSLELVPSHPGISVSVEQTVRAVESSLGLTDRPVSIRATITQPGVRTQDLEDAYDLARTMVSAPVTLTLGERSWTVDESTLHSWLRWRGSGADLRPYLDPTSLEQYARQIASEADGPVRDANLTAFKDGRFQGKITIVPDHPGAQVDAQATARQLEQAAKSPDNRAAPVVAQVTPPKVTASDLQGPLALAQKLTGHRLYMKLNGGTWWLDPYDLVRASRWTDNTGANTRVWLDLNGMISEIMRYVPYNANGQLVDYMATARRAISSLEDGRYRIDIVTVSSDPTKSYEGDLAVWNGHPPARWIDINLSTQTMAAYEGNTPVKVTLVTTGNYVYPSRRTPTGVFHVMEKLSPYKFVSPWPKGSPWYYPPSPVDYAMLFHEGGYYIHDAPWRSEFGPWTNMGEGKPGTDRTGSHGCVNTPSDVMPWFYRWTQVGTPVVVHY